MQLFLELEAETLHRMGHLDTPLPVQPGAWANAATPSTWAMQSHEGMAAASLARGPWTPLTPLTPPMEPGRPRAVPGNAAAPDAAVCGSPTSYSAVPLAAAELVLRSLDEDDADVSTEDAAPGPSLLPARRSVPMQRDGLASRFGLELRSAELRTRAHGRCTARNRGPVNEVVCGALMAAYERAGLWSKVVDVLRRAQRMGVQPNTVMYNIAMSALGKAGEWRAAARLFAMVPQPDVVTHETLVAAYGMAGRVEEAEAAFAALQQAQHAPRDYAYCGLIAAYRWVY